MEGTCTPKATEIMLAASDWHAWQRLICYEALLMAGPSPCPAIHPALSPARMSVTAERARFRARNDWSEWRAIAPPWLDTARTPFWLAHPSITADQIVIPQCTPPSAIWNPSIHPFEEAPTDAWIILDRKQSWLWSTLLHGLSAVTRSAFVTSAPLYASR